jgi:hypothetical protein
LNVVPFSSLRFPPFKDRVEPPLAEASVDCSTCTRPKEFTVDPTVEPAVFVTPPTVEAAVFATPPTVEVVVFTTLPAVEVTPPSNPPPPDEVLRVDVEDPTPVSANRSLLATAARDATLTTDMIDA